MQKIMRIFFVPAFFLMVFVGFSNAQEFSSEGEEEAILRKGISLLEGQLPSKPKDPKIRFNLGNRHYLLGRLLEKKAQEAIQNGVQLTNDSQEAIAHYDESIVQLNECVTLQPENTSAHFNLALGYLARSQAENAIIHMRKAKKLFLVSKDQRGAAKAERALREWYDYFGFRPQDFDSPN